MNSLRNFFSLAGIVFLSLFLAGCTLPSIGGGANQATVWKSGDGGVSFQAKNKIDEKTTLTTAEVLSFVQDRQVLDSYYIGTREHGIFHTENGGETWTRLLFPPTKVYGLSVNARDHNRIYATGSYNNVGKVYRSDNQGRDWDPVYTEPGTGSVLIALAESVVNPEVLYVGNSNGVLFKTNDGGATWTNLKRADGPILQILVQESDPDVVTALIQGKGVIRSTDGGKNWENFPLQAGFGSSQPADNRTNGFGQTATAETPRDGLALAADPSQPNVFYLGTSSGLFRSIDSAKTWTALNIIASSKRFPIHAVSINPSNRNEIVYVSGNTFYKSIDGGINWSTIDLLTVTPVGTILYDRNNPSTIYLGTRKF